jgi:hypothetical protein
MIYAEAAFVEAASTYYLTVKALEYGWADDFFDTGCKNDFYYRDSIFKAQNVDNLESFLTCMEGWDIWRCTTTSEDYGPTQTPYPISVRDFILQYDRDETDFKAFIKDHLTPNGDVGCGNPDGLCYNLEFQFSTSLVTTHWNANCDHNCKIHGDLYTDKGIRIQFVGDGSFTNKTFVNVSLTQSGIATLRPMTVACESGEPKNDELREYIIGGENTGDPGEVASIQGAPTNIDAINFDANVQLDNRSLAATQWTFGVYQNIEDTINSPINFFDTLKDIVIYLDFGCGEREGCSVSP